MSAQKLMIYLAIVAITVLATQANSFSQPGFYGSNATNKSHDLILGYRVPGDRLVMKQNVIKNSSWMKVVIDERSFNTSAYELITMVRILDQKTNGNGAYASVMSGGPGYNSVRLRFKSQRSHGINFVVELYSRR